MSKTQFTMISAWMVNRNINEFLKANRNANRLKLVWSYCLRFTFVDG